MILTLLISQINILLVLYPPGFGLNSDGYVHPKTEIRDANVPKLVEGIKLYFKKSFQSF